MANGLSELSIPVGANIDWDYIERALRLDEFIKRREEQNREAARRFAGQQALQQSLAEGIPLDEAVRQNFSQLYSGQPTTLDDLSRAARPAPEKASRIRTVGGWLVEETEGGQFKPLLGSGPLYEYKEGKAVEITGVERRPRDLSASEVAQQRDIDHEIAAIQKDVAELSEIPRTAWSPQIQELHQTATQRIEALQQQRQDLLSGGKAEPTGQKASAKQKAELANQLAKEHADWPRERIIAEVNKRLP